VNGPGAAKPPRGLDRSVLDSRPAAPHGVIPLAPDLDPVIRLIRARSYHAGRRCPLCDKRIYVGQLLVRAEEDEHVLQHAGCVASAANRMMDPDRLPPRPYGIRVTVTGGRHYANYSFVAAKLETLEISVLSHGAYRGADTLAARWCRRTKCPVRPYLADWDTYHDRAGPIRNRRMLDHFAPQLLVAFTGNVGTADCMDCAQERGIPVWRTWEQPTSPTPRESITG
jgi:hypothetical protein